MTPFPRALAVALPLAVAAPITVAAQADPAPTFPTSFSEPMPLYAVGLGPYSRTIVTTSREAQAYFDQGIQLLYAFTPVDAARSFREAQARDPRCAACYLGEAWAWGPYLNGDMSADDAPRAWAAVREAVDLGPSTNDVEAALIAAMATRYRATHDPVQRERLDSVYADAMADVWARYPDDLDVGTMYAEALMLLEPRRGTWDIESPSVRRIHAVLEDVLARDVSHPGACHLYIHATESTTRPEKAEPCADLLGSAIPGASHVNHMPSHTYNRVGRWGDAVRANQQAWHSDLKAEIGEGFAIYPSHNLHMLLFAASMDGQGAVAVQAGKDYAKIVRGGVFYHALTLLRFGRFDEILALDEAPAPPVQRGLWAFARGYAHLRSGAADSARVYLDSVRAAADADAEFRGHSAADLLGVVGDVLDGEMRRSRGDLGGAIERFRRAVAVEDGLRYDEPEPLNFSARDWLGAALLEAGQPREAESVYREALVDHPHNGWALLGLQSSLTDQGRLGDAALVRRRFDEAWARADVWIRSSRF